VQLLIRDDVEGLDSSQLRNQPIGRRLFPFWVSQGPPQGRQVHIGKLQQFQSATPDDEQVDLCRRDVIFQERFVRA